MSLMSLTLYWLLNLERKRERGRETETEREIRQGDQERGREGERDGGWEELQ